MWRLIKWLIILAIIGFLVVIAYALFGDLAAPQSQSKKQVILEIK